MSLPMNPMLTVRLSLSADQALSLARQINYLLSRVEYFQNGEISTGKNRELLEAGKEEKVLWEMLQSISIFEGVTLAIIPDRLTPHSSGYGYYATPEEDQHLSG